MATTTTQTKTPVPSLEAAFGHYRDLNQQLVTAARKAGNLYADSCEQAADRAIDAELQLADHTQQEWLKNLIDAQADFTREIVSAYSTAVRRLLKSQTP
jgi:hypothetical protein